MEMALTFNDVTLTPIHHQNSLWIRAAELARALGYAREELVSRLYQRNADEFTPDMTQVIEITAEHRNGVLTEDMPQVIEIPAEAQNGLLGSAGRCRIFSPRGCHLISMLARTKVAKEFRKWVLNILDKLAEEERARLSGDVKEIPGAPLSTAASRAPLRSLVHAWAQVSGVSHSALWPQVRAHFQLSRIDDLPESWLPDALAFVQEKIDQCVQGLPNAAPTAELPPAPMAEPERPLIYRDGCFYPPHKNRKHVAGPQEKALLDFWNNEYERRADELDTRFRELLDGIDKAAEKLYPHAVAAIGRDADTMFSISCMLDGLYAAENMARDSFKVALSLARVHMRMATSMAVALNR